MEIKKCMRVYFTLAENKRPRGKMRGMETGLKGVYVFLVSSLQTLNKYVAATQSDCINIHRLK